MTVLKPTTFEMSEAGQSPWLDYISRQILDNGKLKSLIQDSGLLGVTSNPSIFEKAISDPQGGYEKEIHRLIGKNATTFQIYDTLTIADIRRACDLFLPVFQKTKGEHGFVSLEVMPGLAHETEATYTEAVRLFRAVGKPNVMIKVPATKEGLPAIRQLIAKGINVNITLMFSVQHYRDVVRAYMEGLKDFSGKGGNLSEVHSVASVFVSRVDTLVDKKLSSLMAVEKNSAEAKTAFKSLLGKAACANAKIIYQEFKKILSSQEFIALQAKGANIQKVLWGSTSTKNPDYPDLIYVENLIGKETVNTMPLTTLEAFLDHGKVMGVTLDQHLEESHEVVRRLRDLGMELNDIGEVLQKEGVKAFSDSFDSLMGTIEMLRWKEKKNNKRPFGKIEASIPQAERVKAWAAEFQKKDIQSRFFRKDPSLWKLDPPDQKKIANRLGWLDAIDWMFGKIYALDLLAEEIKKDKIRDIVLLGMGGSSLAPEVMSFVFKKNRPRYPKFHILDTTDAANILRVEKQLNLSNTLFIVASKSGTTIETVSQFRYFYDKVSRSLKALPKKTMKRDGRAGRHFIAITDEDSWLEKTARELGFRSVFINPSDIGGRFSALSYFGMVPAALMGIPVRDMLRSALSMLESSKNEKDAERNPAMFLGLLLGQLARAGNNKLTFWMSPELSTFAYWIEQLVAESTGKDGKGIVPVEGEPVLSPDNYGSDRVFFSMKLQGEKNPQWQDALKKVKKAGFPVIELDWPEKESLGAEFFRWEIATSVTGSLLDINPFDEPNVQESKDNTAKILKDFRISRKISLPKGNADVGTLISQLKEDGYIGLLAYTERSDEVLSQLNRIRKKVAEALKVPVLAGFGPRYLHSIGQLYKGGTRNGIFIELCSQPKPDLKIPEADYTFNQLKNAQALGDFEALQSKGLPAIVFDLGRNPVVGLRLFEKTVMRAISR